jgi:hypothetical protein
MSSFALLLLREGDERVWLMLAVRGVSSFSSRCQWRGSPRPRMMVMRAGGGAIWVTALNISQEQARAHRPFTRLPAERPIKLPFPPYRLGGPAGRQQSAHFGRLWFAKTPAGRQKVDPTLISGQSQLNDQPPGQSISSFPLPLRRPPPARPGEPRLASPSRRVQANARPAQAAHGGSAVLGWTHQGLDRLEAVSRVRDSRHRRALAATPFPQALGQALSEVPGRPPICRPRDHRPRPKNGRRQSAVGRSPNPWGTPGARD